MLIRTKVKQGKAVKISATFNGNVQDYALAWLHLTNNARENPNIFLKHWNNSGNSVYVVTPEKYADQMKEYLTGLNSSEFTVKIWDVETITTITPVIDWCIDYKNDAECEEADNAEVLPHVDA